MEDDRGNLWISTNNGVARFDSQRRIFSTYSTAEGLPGPNLAGWGTCFNSPSGEMFFGGFSGATSFSPDQLVDNSYVPPIVLTDFRLSGNPVKIGSRSPLHRSISYVRDLILSHQQNIFSLTFAALSYAGSETNRYRYKLESLERDWNEVGSDVRQATYTTLPAGKYTFRVQGATSGGAWSDPGVAVRIQILPPWWGTWWFQSVCVIFTLVSLWFAYSLRLQQIAREFNARLEERLDERTRIARDLHDTLLQSLAGVSMQLHGIAKQASTAPEKTAGLVERVRQQVDAAFREARLKVYNLRSPALEGQGLAEALSEFTQRLGAMATARCTLAVTGAPRPSTPEIEEELLRIAQEAANNANRHAQASEIRISLDYSENSLELSICDDGSGFDLEEGYRKEGHWGLKNMQERAARIGGKCTISSAPGKGTRVEVRVPLRSWPLGKRLGKRSDSNSGD